MADRKACFEFFEDDENSIDVLNIKDDFKNLTDYEIERTSIFILKKHEKDFEKLQKMIIDHPKIRTQKSLIIDDESDFASVGYKMGKNSEDSYRRICGEILKLRNLLPRANYLSVTATPYVLYLSRNWMIRPSSTILLPAHKNYFGGEFLFISQEKTAKSIRENYVQQEEFDKVLDQKTDQYRNYIHQFPMLTKALINFILGGLIRNKQSNSKNPIHYSMLVHIDTQKDGHNRQKRLLMKLIEIILLKMKQQDASIMLLIEECYGNLQATSSESVDIPLLETLLEPFIEGLAKQTKINIMNSDYHGQIPTDSEGNIKNPVPFSIFIGAYAIDRGVTFNKLISFVFGRPTKVPSMDSALQQLRIFGARSKEDLNVTRVYALESTVENWIQICELEEKIRDNLEIMEAAQQLAQKSEYAKRIVNVLPAPPKGIRFGAKQKIEGTQIKMKPYSRLLPTHFTTSSDEEVVKGVMEELNQYITSLEHCYTTELLEGKYPFITVNTAEAIELIEKSYSTLVALDGREINTFEQCLFVLLMMKKQGKDKVHLYVRYNRDRKAIRRDGKFDSAPDSGVNGDYAIAKKIGINYPVLTLLHQNGSVENGFNDCPFFWPILTLPQNLEYDLVSLK
ncbi:MULTISPECIES: Z1 domain-containing protein [unclassified Lysinibacillus]|uniref:Z1 domain-containing protein n=1 Tax=unclassified Lysinibacillus TaxID=2636778 RepID=UPI001117A744|nr:MULTISPECIES: Z1 domain-containing protein [unclassified Lysinibacillus]